MQLTYRGIAYNPQPSIPGALAEGEIPRSPIKGKYRGIPYTYVSSPLPRAGKTIALQYRGSSYFKMGAPAPLV